MNINQLLDTVIARKASDLHLVVGYPPSLRVNGELIPIIGAPIISDTDMTEFVSLILSSNQKMVFEATLEMDLGYSFQGKARFRINIFRAEGHIAAALRFIPTAIPPIEGLGLPPAVLKLTDLRQGFILVTGPTGHGKSTTLASFINKINQVRAAKILTIEDPIEYVYPKAKSIVTQREMFMDTKAWTNALKAALREDPDVVLVGEMRDYETIAAAITIAETGHLVLATLHTNSASQTVDRIIDVFPMHQQPQVRLQLASTLVAVISQRLVPTIVPGRALAVELLLGNPALSSLIRDGKSYLIDNLIQTSGELGMISLEMSLVKLIQQGQITFEVAQNYTLRPDLFAKLVGR